MKRLLLRLSARTVSVLLRALLKNWHCRILIYWIFLRRFGWNFDMILICDMEKAKGTLKDVQDALGMLGKELGMDVRVQLADIFYAMHRI